MDERMTESERATLCRRIDELCAENERLRQESQVVGMAAYDLGYKNGSVNYELEHCPACKNIADLQEALAENAELRELLQASLHDFRRIYSCDEQDGWKMVDAIDRMVIGMRELGLDAGRTEQEMRVKVDE